MHIRWIYDMWDFLVCPRMQLKNDLHKTMLNVTIIRDHGQSHYPILAKTLESLELIKCRGIIQVWSISQVAPRLGLQLRHLNLDSFKKYQSTWQRQPRSEKEFRGYVNLPTVLDNFHPVHRLEVVTQEKCRDKLRDVSSKREIRY